MIDSYNDEKVCLGSDGEPILKAAQNISLDVTLEMVLESCIEKKISFFIQDRLKLDLDREELTRFFN